MEARAVNMTRGGDGRWDGHWDALDLLDTPTSASLDRITPIAARISGLPISAVSLTDRQWFKPRMSVEHTSIPREKARCAQVAETNQVLVIPDLLADPFHADSTLAGSGILSCAGAPLVTPEGFGRGAPCVLGRESRTALDTEVANLADMVRSQVEMRHAFGRIDPLSGLPKRTRFPDKVEDLGRDLPGQHR